VEVVQIPTESDSQRLNLTSILSDLGKRGILQVMVEGGGLLHSALLKQRLVNRLVVYQGPALIGSSGLPWLQGSQAETMSQISFFTLVNVRQIGNDIRSEYDCSQQT